MELLERSTASIDTETEELLQTALAKLAANRTTIVIAHRLSTIINADKILHLEDGGVLESGTHDQLLKNKGKYAKMFASQHEF